MRHPALFAPAVLLLAAGCSQPSPALPDATAAKTPAPAAAPNTVLGRYTLEIDPVTLTARVTAPRAAQDNDGVYLLPIDSFLSTGGVTVQKVRLTATTLDIDYTFTHPFPASGTTNRADLGVSGFLLFFADVPSTTGHRYFTGTDDVVVNTGLVANADAYWAPRGLLDTEAYTANTFPYKLLVDEANDPRLDAASGAPVSNGGNPTGNYTAPNGWQTGGSETWTGYGVLHQGQAATSTVGLDLTALEAADFSLDFAAIAKYNDPRSGTPPKAHRLPSSPPNLLTGFGYRMPHGALDVERIVYRGEGGGFQAETASSSELRF
ncbi:MAG TPA: hypothetical protein VEI97_03985, partial [bacterium]|nr:hypothetical protein [bacterium]